MIGFTVALRIPATCIFPCLGWQGITIRSPPHLYSGISQGIGMIRSYHSPEKQLHGVLAKFSPSGHSLIRPVRAPQCHTHNNKELCMMWSTPGYVPEKCYCCWCIFSASLWLMDWGVSLPHRDSHQTRRHSVYNGTTPQRSMLFLARYLHNLVGVSTWFLVS